jgi:hypothetical protein
MTTAQRVAQIFGWIFVLIAAWGFFVSRGSMDANMATAPRILDLFAVNVLHNLAHLVLGIWGILAARSFDGAKTYCTIVGVLYIVLAIVGYIEPTTWGLIPLGGADIGLHAALGVILLLVGITARPRLTPAAA